MATPVTGRGCNLLFTGCYRLGDQDGDAKQRLISASGAGARAYLATFRLRDGP